MRKLSHLAMIVMLFPVFAQAAITDQRASISTFSEQVETADAIVLGIVDSYESKRLEGLTEQGEINTLIKFRGTQLISQRGTIHLDDQLILRFWGGKQDQSDGTMSTRIIAGTPEYETGEKMIIFIYKNGSSKIPLVGHDKQIGVVRINDDGMLTNQRNSTILGLWNDQIVYESSFNMCSSDALENVSGSQLNPNEELEDLTTEDAAGSVVSFSCPDGPGSYIEGNDRPRSLDSPITEIKFIEAIQEILKSRSIPVPSNLSEVLSPDVSTPLNSFNQPEYVDEFYEFVRKTIDSGNSHLLSDYVLKQFHDREERISNSGTSTSK